MVRIHLRVPENMNVTQVVVSITYDINKNLDIEEGLSRVKVHTQ